MMISHILSNRTLITRLALLFLLINPLSSATADEKKVETKDVGEASYNVENCEAAKENGNKKNYSDNKIDLDKCKKFINTQ